MTYSTVNGGTFFLEGPYDNSTLYEKTFSKMYIHFFFCRNISEGTVKHLPFETIIGLKTQKK